MTDDRTKPHPLYWHREGRALAVRDPRDDLPLAGCIGQPQAIEQSWRHADALIREGYMLALERVRALRLHDHERCMTPDEVHILDIAATRVARSAPGESDS